jgi:tellurite resistance-related uncharacterized protein
MDAEKANEFMEMILEELFEVYERLEVLQDKIKDHGFVEKKEMESLEEKAETVQAANDEVPVVEAKQVHKMRAKQ